MKTPKYAVEINNAIIAFAKGDAEGAKIRPIAQTGSGRFAKYSSDHSLRIIRYLEKCRMLWKKGNDAPRGGKLGDYIQVVGCDMIGTKAKESK